ncbi:MAG: DUF4238 domain-containing protein [Methylococcales bacterium]|nr:DUF4238 domain-containing protein [Methylococcales bacterium]MDD5630906.1 DUF4238 domain-containing protein [Methylococcales bacterium]
MTARHHHYLSQCYLKGFTKGKAKNSKLTVFDFKERKWFETIPRNVGGIRDFNRINIEGIDQNVIESTLSDFEGKAASALKKLEETLVFTAETQDLILNLIALVGIRSPEKREHLRRFEAEVIERLMSLSLESKERWEVQEAQRKEENPEYVSKVSYEELKEFFDSKKYEITLTNEHHIGNEMVMIKAILPYLYRRNWILVRATKDAAPFITTDNPVSLTWNEPEKIPPFYRGSPGFGMSDTQVYFPVSQDLALIGEFDGENKIIIATPELVSILNTKMLYNAYKQIYSPKIGFHFFSKDGAILDGHRILSEMNQ